MDSLTRRRVLQGGAGAAAVGALSAGGLLSVGADGAGAAPLAQGVPLAGWNLYGPQATNPDFHDGIRSHKPSVVRWFIEWDRTHLQVPGGPAIPDPPDWSVYDDFFSALAPSEENPEGTHLIVQVWVKSPTWLGWGQSFPGQVPGTQWAKLAANLNYPANCAESYDPFVQSLAAHLDDAGLVSVEWGAWNEVDGRYAVSWRGSERVPNYHNPWYMSVGNWAWWTGGSGERWRELHDSLPGASWTTNGIYYDSWVDATSPNPAIKTIDLHRYFGGDRSADDFVTHVLEQVGKWDRNAPSGSERPVMIGELGSNAANAPLDTREAARLWQRHHLLWEEHVDPDSSLYGRYLGAAAHVRFLVDASDPNWAWWEYRDEYEEYLDPGNVPDPAFFASLSAATTTTTTTTTLPTGTSIVDVPGPDGVTSSSGSGSSGALPHQFMQFFEWLGRILGTLGG